MTFLAANGSEIETRIDTAFDAADSIVLRYRNALRFASDPHGDLALKSLLLDTSIREGVQVIDLLSYGGVEVHVLDETSRMATGSLKSIDGCLAAAVCRRDGSRRLVFESGGNTGTALTRYGQRAGIETFFFCPGENVDLLDSGTFAGETAHLIAVEERGAVKDLAGFFASETGIRHVPERSWRHLASLFRGLFLLEHMRRVGTFDWIVQTVSAAFGPIGIYEVLGAPGTGLWGLPRFLGVQQEANCPMYRAWKTRTPGRGEAGDGQRLLARVMYDATPQTYGTFESLKRLLVATRGDLLTVNERDFDSYICSPREWGTAVGRFCQRGIDIGSRSGEILEKTGLIALAGVLKAIDAGTIEAGSRVLCCLTSGVSQADGRARPEALVGRREDVSAYIERVLEGG